MFCNKCGAAMEADASFCRSCGAPAGASAADAPAPPPGAGPATYGASRSPALKSKLAAALLGIFLGGLGIHRFYLGYNAIGVAQLTLGLLGFVTCGVTSIAAAIWGLVEGILILTGSINRDAQGNPLAE
jgi:TM2 domain-containing membrane protein YozV